MLQKKICIIIVLYYLIFWWVSESTYAINCPDWFITEEWFSEVCLPEDLKYFLDDNIKNYTDQLINGRDTQEIQNEIVQNSSYYNEPNLYPEDTSYDNWKNFYSILSLKFQIESEILCKESTFIPEVIIPTSGVYSENSIAVKCSEPEDTNFSGFSSISVSFLDQNSEKVYYTHTGSSFSGSIIDLQGNGDHSITCSYRPTSCKKEKISEKNISVETPYKKREKQLSIAREWNEVILNAIRKDRVRPPIQARNLFHFSATLYDVWNFYTQKGKNYLFWKSGITTCMTQIEINSKDTSAALEKSISYAAYNIIRARYQESPWYNETMLEANALMNRLGYDINEWSSIWSVSQSAFIGETIANCYLEYGKIDGSNELGASNVEGEFGSYSNKDYTPINPGIDPNQPGNPNLVDWNRWQPILLNTFTDQWGNLVPSGSTNFIGAEWWNVIPFSLKKSQQTIHQRDGKEYISYLDPGLPPQANWSTLKFYEWNFALVAAWSSHLDPKDNVYIDISPKSLGNSKSFPETPMGMVKFYNTTKGGTQSYGIKINPVTQKPYLENKVLRGDYTRVISEYWADGPNSETPPWHWFTILNKVSDKMDVKKFEGKWEVLWNLEWDIKSYFTLWWALHDAAIAAWGIKGSYDGIRPISAIRAMAVTGQSSNKNLPSYNPRWIRLIPWYIELVESWDSLEGRKGVNIGKIKMKGWKWPKYIINDTIDTAGVDWILAEDWWPYQRATFVTPPFGGYISGHSTFSRTAAEVLTDITGNPFFPGWILEIPLKARNYLVFEQWPSTDITLQWATYRDAANESALSRIWWGIHAPMDDIPGRLIGEKIGKQASKYATSFF